MQTVELQELFDDMFPNGARFNNNVGDLNSFIFWVARPAAIADDAVLVKPVGSQFMVPYIYDDQPDIAEDQRSVTFGITDPEGRVRTIQFDSWFEPGGLEADIAAERKVQDDGWLEIQRADHAAQQEAS